MLKWVVLLLSLLGGLALILAIPALGHESSEPLDLDLPPVEVPEPQFFCGYCHLLTYPNVVKKAYDTWKEGKHNQYGCVECHYPPSPERAEPTPAADKPVKPHIPPVPPQRFSYVPLGGNSVQTRPRVVDPSCTTAQCHGRPDDQYQTKKIQFTEKVPFVHEPHLAAKNQIEGQKLNCVSCHQRETEKKHFEVSKASCHLCHFNNAGFNEGRGRCEVCHTLPAKPIQTTGEKPITHQMLKEADVACGSCHYEVIQAAGGGRYQLSMEAGVIKTAVLLGAGQVKDENCLTCHDKEEAIKEVKNRKLMHEKHVAVKEARCFDCHRPIGHAKVEREVGQQPFEASCQACHPEHHRFQRALAAGEKQEGVISAPDPMLKAGTNCLACHNEQGLGATGEPVMKASAKTCVACHAKEHEEMLAKWKAELKDEIEFSRELEKEVADKLAGARDSLSPERLKEADELMAKARGHLSTVVHGNGVHNKKYAMLLIDAAVTAFDDVDALLKR